MGECGCASCCKCYRLPISKTACFMIELYPGCKDCVAPPGVVIRRVEKSSSSYWEEAQDCPEMKLAAIDGYHEAAIQCGLDSDEFRKEVVRIIEGTDVGDDTEGKIDDVLAEILADDIWGDVVFGSLKMIEYKDRDPTP